MNCMLDIGLYGFVANRILIILLCLDSCAVVMILSVVAYLYDACDYSCAVMYSQCCSLPDCAPIWSVPYGARYHLLAFPSTTTVMVMHQDCAQVSIDIYNASKLNQHSIRMGHMGPCLTQPV